MGCRGHFDGTYQVDRPLNVSVARVAIEVGCWSNTLYFNSAQSTERAEKRDV